MTDLHPEDIKAAIRKSGGTLSSLAAAQGVSVQALSAAISGRTSARLEAAIAAYLGVSPATIWPSRYNSKGDRIRFARHPSSGLAAA